MERSLSGSSEEEMSITKGPWTEEEDSVLFNYITVHGEGHWNSVARYTGMQSINYIHHLNPSFFLTHTHHVFNHRSKTNGQKLQIKMVKLLASKCSTWEHNPRRTALDS